LTTLNDTLKKEETQDFWVRDPNLKIIHLDPTNGRLSKKSNRLHKMSLVVSKS
jgi:hypothetical protein